MYTCVKQAPNTAQIILYQALYNQLVADINTQNYSNYIALYDNYNDTVMQAYQQSLYAIQAAFFLQYLNNEANYDNAIAYLN